MKENFKRYIISSAVTFIGTFAVAFGSVASTDTFVFTKAAITSAVFSALVVAARAVFKVITELGVYLLSNKQ